MLDSHRDITCPPETKLAGRVAIQAQDTVAKAGPVLRGEHGLGEPEIYQAYGMVVWALLERLRRRAGTKYIADKTPTNLQSFATLHRMLPDSRLVHVLRDGRDVVASLLRQRWVAIGTNQRLPYTVDAGEAAGLWARSVGVSRDVMRGPARRVFHEVRYEDLVTDPQGTLTALMHALDIPFDPRMLRHHEFAHQLPDSEASSAAVRSPVNRSAIGKWRTALTPEQRRQVAAVAGPTLVALGYAADDTWVEAP